MLPAHWKLTYRGNGSFRKEAMFCTHFFQSFLCLFGLFSVSLAFLLRVRIRCMHVRGWAGNLLLPLISALSLILLESRLFTKDSIIQLSSCSMITTWVLVYFVSWHEENWVLADEKYEKNTTTENVMNMQIQSSSVYASCPLDSIEWRVSMPGFLLSTLFSSSRFFSLI